MFSWCVRARCEGKKKDCKELLKSGKKFKDVFGSTLEQINLGIYYSHYSIRV